MQFSREFTKIKKDMHSEHEDLETMIKYEIIGIENAIECCCACTGDRVNKGYGVYFAIGVMGYRFRSYAIEKVCARICEVQM